jgi:glutathione synthase/RimK-type ligase-like ATP-grasp enzyme
VLVLLVTFSLMPEGEPGGEHLVAAFAERGVEARWVRWDDDSVDWAGADQVAVRATWDYHRRCAEFLAWARSVQAVTTLLNGADVFAWNADKAYLLELAEHVPTVPTDLLADAGLVPDLAAALDRWDQVVVKPRTGAGGVGVVVANSLEDERLSGLSAGPWVVQPVVESVRTTGETSVFVLGGAAVAQVDKVPGAGEIRVHEHLGGRSRAVDLGAEQAALAEAAVAAACRRLDTDLSYARVDMMRWDGRWAVSELELIEPGLYLDIDPANAPRFVEAVLATVAP